MASTLNVFLCAGLAILVYACIGLPLAARVAARPLALMLAPALGWAAHSAAALPLFYVVGLSRTSVAVVFAVAVAAAVAALWIERAQAGEERALTRITAIALIGAALLALSVAAAVLPKISAEGVVLAAPAFDHSKVAMIDEMARLGVPPGNPFYGGAEGPARLVYYYLWHFSAAEFSLLAQVSGWEADAALTWFTAFASLAAMIGLAVWLSGRGAAALWVVALAATESLRPLLGGLFGAEQAQRVIGAPSGFGGWLFQTSWAPQHMASATSAAIATLLLSRLAERRSLTTLLMLALTMTAAFESSTWVGGVVWPLAAVPIALLMVLRAPPRERLSIMLHLAGAALVALALISPFLHDQYQMAAAHGGALAIAPYPVLDPTVANPLVRLANLPAFWLIFLVVEFPAFYLAGVVSLVVLLKERAPPERGNVTQAFAVLLIASLGAAWLLASTLGFSNDLGWRAVLPAVLLLIVFAAAGLARLAQKPASAAFAAALALVLLALPDGARMIYANVVAAPNPAGKVFATTPALWQAVRRHAAPNERIANNPYFLAELTPWPGNISWALLANRRSCFAGNTFTRPFSALSGPRGERIEAQFVRVFSGQGDADDVQQMAVQYHCTLAVLTPEDGAWSRDPFAASPSYRLVEATAAWRIYKLVTLAAR